MTGNIRAIANFVRAIMKSNMYIVAFFLLALATAEGESSEDSRINSSSLVGDDNDLGPFEANSKLLTDWVKVRNKDENREVHIVEGQTLSLTCESLSSRVPLIGWYKGNLRVTEEMDEENDISPLGMVRLIQKFVAPCASLLHSGLYYCKGASRGSNSESGVTKVVVHRTRPGFKLATCKLTKGKARLTLFVPFMWQELGTDVVIPCRAAGLPAPSITWTRDKHSINDKRFQVLENGDLLISKLRWSDMADYWCHASNEFGSDSHKTFLYPLTKQ